MKKKVIIAVICLIIVFVGIIIIINPKNIIKKEKYDGKRTTTVQTTAVKKEQTIPEGYVKTISDAANSIDINSDVYTIASQIGTATKNKDNSYNIRYSDNENILIQLDKNNTVLNVSVSYDLYTLIDEFVDFSKNKEFQSKFQEYTYDDIRIAFKSAGTIDYKSKETTEYTWVNNKGEFIKAAFNKENKCVSYTGILKYA
jgi:hypothetical protein